MTIKKPDLGTDYSGIETIKKYVKKMQADYEHSHIEDILGYVLWILDDYKKMKQGNGTNFSRITKSPEALAEFISKATIAAWFAQANSELPKPNGSREWLAWLKQESKE